MTATIDRPARSATKLAPSAPAGCIDLRPSASRTEAIMRRVENYLRADDAFLAAEDSDRARRQSAHDEAGRATTFREPPGADWWIALVCLIQEVVAGPLPKRFVGAFLQAVERLAVSTARHLLEGGGFDSWPAGGRDGVFNARDALRHALAQLDVVDRPRPRLEKISELHAQGVDLEQLGRMWGLVWATGEGKTHLVQAELDNPGSVIGPDYVPPIERERASDAAQIKQSTSGFELSVAATKLASWANECGYKFE